VRKKQYAVYFVVALALCIVGVLRLRELAQRTDQLGQQLSAIEKDVAEAPVALPPVTVAPVPVAAAPEPTPPVVEPEPAPAVVQDSATYITPRGSAALMPLEGWVDQPNKDRPGRVHTNLMIRRATLTPRAHVPARAPCLRPERFPAEVRKLPYGKISLPARTILVPCTS
jgi:hypothetical protein